MKRVRLLFQATLALGLLAFLLSQVPFEEVAISLAKVSPFWALAGFIFFLLADYLRSLRFKLLLAGEVEVIKLFPIVVLQGFTNSMLPARLGEVFYLYLLRKTEGVPLGYGLSSLLLARIGDVLAIMLLFLASALSLQSYALLSLRLILVALLALAVLLPLVAYLVTKREGAKEWFAVLWLSRLPLVGAMLTGAEDVIKGLRMVRSPRVLVPTLFLSLLVWVGAFMVSYSLVQAVGLPLSLWQVFFALCFIQLLSALPIAFLGGLGIVDASWVFFFLLFGIPRSQAIASALVTHSIFYLYLLLVSAFSLGIMLLFSGRLAARKALEGKSL